MRTRLGAAVVLAALIAVNSMLLGAPPASAQQAQSVHLDLILLTRTAGTPTTGERWEGSARTFATGEQWNLTIDLDPWGALHAVCGRRLTFRLESTTNLGDVIAGGGEQGNSGYTSLSASEYEGRFAGLHAETWTQPGWLPVLPGLWQLGGGCGIGGFLGAILPPVTGPLQVLSLAHVLPLTPVTMNVPIALGSLRFDLVPD